MDWSTLLAAFIGGIFGGGITGAAAFVQLRRDKAQALQARRWTDAEVAADARKLLEDINPQPRTFNVNPAPGVEKKLWEGFSDRRESVYRQLLLLAAGHPSQEVSEAAKELSTALLWTFHYTQLAVAELLTHRPNFPQLIEDAQERHATAMACIEKLETAIKAAAAPRRRQSRRLWRTRKLREIEGQAAEASS